jgi:hypothetical protein
MTTKHCTHRLRCYLCLIYSSILLAYTSPISAATDTELTARELKASKVVSAVTAVEREWGRLKIARDRFFYGDKGAHTLSVNWLQQAFEWIDDWDRQLIAIQISGPNAVNHALSAVESLINQQEAKLNVLDNAYLSLRKQIEQGQSFLKKKQPLDPNHLADYRQVLTAIEASQGNLTQAFNQLRQNSNTQLQKLRKISQVSTQAIRAKLKSQMIAAGIDRLQDALNAYDQVVTYERDVLSQLSKLTSAEMEMDNYSLNFQYFSAKQRANTAIALCQSVQQGIASTSISHQKKTHALNQAKATCKAIQGHWNTLSTLGITPAEMVFEYGQMQALNFENECSKKQPRINCEKYAVLKSLPLKTLHSMSAKELEFYEHAWQQIELDATPKGEQS